MKMNSAETSEKTSEVFHVASTFCGVAARLNWNKNSKLGEKQHLPSEGTAFSKWFWLFFRDENFWAAESFMADKSRRYVPFSTQYRSIDPLGDL